MLAGLLGSLRERDASSGGARPATTTAESSTSSPPTTESSTPTTTTTTEPPPATNVSSDPVELNDRAFALMQEGQYGRARPLLDRAVAALDGTGSITEAYASYNLAFTRFALGRCDGVLALLDRSEAVQGERREIDSLREDVEDRCTEGDEDRDRGKGNGGRGKNEDD